MKIKLSQDDKDEMGEHVAYCSTCVSERGDAGLGWCDKHMGPSLRRVIQQQIERRLSQ